MDAYGASSSDDVNPPRLFINWSVLQQLLQNNTDGDQIKHTLSVASCTCTDEDIGWSARDAMRCHSMTRVEHVNRPSHCRTLTSLVHPRICPLVSSLLKLDGSLLTSSHDTPQTKGAAAAAASLVSSVSSGPSSPSPPVLPKILGALVANIFKTAESNGVNFLQAQQLNMMMLDCEGGIVAVSRLARFLICIYATKRIDVGMLRLKMNELLTNLQPLNTVYAQ
jgi:predicted regulator of Ras-like GTPase activity (Roadblock/LC7/MglB family)